MLKPLTYLNIFCFSFFSIAAFAQTPCDSGMAGVYPCDNIDLNAYINLGTSNLNANKANDIWGWTSAGGTEYAIVGLDNGTAFVDISNANSPVIVGKLAKHSSNSTWRDIKVANNHAYIGSEATGSGIQIFNLDRLTTATNLPVNFTEDGWIDLGSGTNRSHNVVVSPLTGYIIPVGTSSLNSGGMTFYNTTNPTNPTLEGSYDSDGYSHDAVCVVYRGPDTEHMGKEICIGFNEDNLAIADVTVKGNPSTINTFTYPGNFYCHQGWITDDHKYLLVDDELDESNIQHNTKTYIFDISDLENPILKFTYFADTESYDHNLYIKGPYAYQANYTAGLRVLDISNLDNSVITEVGYFDNYPANNNRGFHGSWSVYPYFKSGKMVMTNIDQTYRGLHVITPNLPHYVMEVVGNGVESICQGQEVTYSFDATAYAGFSSTDNITVSGLPSGATANFSSNPIATDAAFTMTVSTTTTTLSGNYNIVLTGTEIPVNRVAVALVIIPISNGLPTTVLVSPPHNASDQLLEVSFDWDPVSGATFYDLEISTDQTFSTIDFSAYSLISTEYIQAGLEEGSTYFWRVTSRDNNCASSNSNVVFGFRTIEGPLPAELISFKATAKSKEILLDWSTASELGFFGFDLQRATEADAIDFQKISWIPGNTINSSGSAYNFLDKDVVAGQTYYYRLRQLDLDGTVAFSPIVSARLNSSNGNLQLFPNPVDKELTLLLEQQIFASTDIALTIYDVIGKQVRSIIVSANELNNGYSLNVNSLEKGTYLISLEGNRVKETVRFVKR
ncbi:MAG: choice-of-anchor B domain-containing protein [Flavobacteriales bacterium]|jgi:choice-of-anchor B domain-containing protein